MILQNLIQNLLEIKLKKRIQNYYNKLKKINSNYNFQILHFQMVLIHNLIMNGINKNT